MRRPPALLAVGSLLATTVLTVGPLVGRAAAADGDLVTAFGTNGRATLATGPTPSVNALASHYLFGDRDVAVEYGAPARIGLVDRSANAVLCSVDPCQLPTPTVSGRVYFTSGPFLNVLFGPGAVSGTYDAPGGNRYQDPVVLGTGADGVERLFATLVPADPSAAPYLVLLPSPSIEALPRPLGPVGVPEGLDTGGFAVARTDGADLAVTFYDGNGDPDGGRGAEGAVRVPLGGPVTVQAAVALAGGGLAVLASTPAGGGATRSWLVRIGAGDAVDVVTGPSLTWTPRLIETGDGAVALVGNAPNPTVVRVVAAAPSPFTTTALVGGPTVVDDAVADVQGRLVAVGGAAGARSTMVVARYGADGTLDATFGSNGVVNRSLAQSTMRAFRVTISETGEVLAAASQDDSIVVDALVGGALRAFRSRVVVPGLAPVVTGAFVPTAPTRLFDSRTGFSLRAQVPVTVDLSSVVPTGAVAVAMNVTAVDPAAPGFARVWATEDAMPETSMLNFDTGETVANATVSRVGDSRIIQLYSHVNTDLVVDVTGYWVGRTTARAGRLVPHTPVRLLDTRVGGAAAPGDGSVTTVDVRGRTDLGLEHASAVALSVTVADPVGPGFVTVWPSGVSRPLASSLNVNRAGELRSNLAIVGVGADGTVSIFNQRGTHLVVDLVASFTDSTSAPAATGLVVTQTPTRVDDSRLSAAGPLQAGRPARTSLHCCGAATAAIYNLTAVDPTDAGFLTAFPVDAVGAVPLTSNVNFDAAGQRRASLAVTPLDADGTVGLYSNVGTDYVVDVLAAVT